MAGSTRVPAGHAQVGEYVIRSRRGRLLHSCIEESPYAGALTTRRSFARSAMALRNTEYVQNLLSIGMREKVYR
jgi:hypothetical protein